MAIPIRKYKLSVALGTAGIVFSLGSTAFAGRYVVSQFDSHVFSGSTAFDDFRISADYLYFAATAANGTEVFRTDGDQLEEFDILPGSGSSFPNLNIFTGLDDYFLIRARGAIGLEVFSIDSIGGIIEIDLIPGPAGSSIGNWADIGDSVLLAINAPNGPILYRTNGRHLSVLSPQPDFSDTLSFVGRGTSFKRAMILEADDSSGFHMYKTDGSSLVRLFETDPVSERASGSIAFSQVNDRLLFRARSAGTEYYYQTDGETISFIPRTTAGTLVASPGRAKNLGTKLYFSGSGPNGNELFMTDGERTVEYDILPGPLGSSVGHLSAFQELNGEVLLRAVGTHGDEVFVTTGEDLIEFDINPGPGGSFAERFKGLPGRAYFSAVGTNGRELFMTDGATLIELDMNTGPASSLPYADDGTLLGKCFFLSAIGANGRELFVVEGQSFREFDINLGADSSNPDNFIEFDDSVFFTATNADGLGIFRTDGTMVEQISALDPVSGGQIFGNSFARFEQSLYFLADSPSGIHMFKISGIPEPNSAVYAIAGVLFATLRRYHLWG